MTQGPVQEGLRREGVGVTPPTPPPVLLGN